MKPLKNWNDLTWMEQDLTLFFVNVWVRKKGGRPKDWKDITNHLLHRYQVKISIKDLESHYYLRVRSNLFTFRRDAE